MVVEITLCFNPRDKRQLAWAKVREGDAILSFKIVRAKSGWPFVTVPTDQDGLIRTPLWSYENLALFEAKKKAILEEFRLAVPEEIFYPPKHGEGETA